MQRLRKAATNLHPGLKGSGSVVDEGVCSDESMLLGAGGTSGLVSLGRGVVTPGVDVWEDFSIFTGWLWSRCVGIVAPEYCTVVTLRNKYSGGSPLCSFVEMEIACTVKVPNQDTWARYIHDNHPAIQQSSQSLNDHKNISHVVRIGATSVGRNASSSMSPYRPSNAAQSGDGIIVGRCQAGLSVGNGTRGDNRSVPRSDTV